MNLNNTLSYIIFDAFEQELQRKEEDIKIQISESLFTYLIQTLERSLDNIVQGNIASAIGNELYIYEYE